MAGVINLFHICDRVNMDSDYLHAWGTFCGCCEPLVGQHEPFPKGLPKWAVGTL